MGVVPRERAADAAAALDCRHFGLSIACTDRAGRAHHRRGREKEEVQSPAPGGRLPPPCPAGAPQQQRCQRAARAPPLPWRRRAVQRRGSSSFHLPSALVGGCGGAASTVVPRSVGSVPPLQGRRRCSGGARGKRCRPPRPPRPPHPPADGGGGGVRANGADGWRWLLRRTRGGGERCGWSGRAGAGCLAVLERATATTPALTSVTSSLPHHCRT